MLQHLDQGVSAREGLNPSSACHGAALRAFQGKWVWESQGFPLPSCPSSFLGLGHPPGVMPSQGSFKAKGSEAKSPTFGYPRTPPEPHFLEGINPRPTANNPNPKKPELCFPWGKTGAYDGARC